MDWEGEEEKVNRGWIKKYINYDLLFQDWHATPCGIIFLNFHPSISTSVLISCGNQYWASS